MRRGADPDRIAFLSFTRKAANEAAERAMDRFGFKRSDLPHFQTVHAMVFRQLGMKRDEMMSFHHYRELGKILHMRFSTGKSMEDGVPDDQARGDRYIFLDNFARTRGMKPEEAWHLLSGDDSGLDWFEFRQFRETLRLFKKEKGLMDFTDILQEFVNLRLTLPVDVAIIDEAQDLSTLQWQAVEGVVGPAQRSYIAGDDDQAIYTWSGADVDHFLNLPGRRVVLNQSHRLPASIYRIADHIAHQISRRFDKPWKSREEEGEVHWHNTLDSIDLRQGSWLLLARNTHLLSSLVAIAREQGYPYTYRGESVVKASHICAIQAWEALRKGSRVPLSDVKTMALFIRHFPLDLEAWQGRDVGMGDLGIEHPPIWHRALLDMPEEDREYYIALLRSGESLTRPPRIHINTIHGVKGGEADNVCLLTDMASRTFQGYQQDPDSEHRVFFVGASRARHVLHLVQPLTNKYYQL